jgi:outer membrane protein OmpA-like peptidoglycan-associated protein
MKQFILLLVCIFVYFNTIAQDDNSAKGWSIGTEKGYAQITGEVRPASGFGFGIYGDRSFTNFLSARIQVGMGDVRGLDRTTSRNWLNHPVWNGSLDPAINYNNAFSNSIYANYKTSYLEASLQAVFTFTQLPFLKNNSPFDGFLLVGIGGMRYTTMVDAIDENGLIYDFATVEATPAFTDAETIANLNTIADGNYETQSNQDPQFTPLYQFGAGLKWKVRKNISLSLTHRVSLTGKDDLDSYMWNPDNTKNGVNDLHHFSTIGVSYTFKKKAKQPLPEIPSPTLSPEPEPEPLPEPVPEVEIEPVPEPEPEPIPEPEPEPSVEIVELTIDEEEVVKRAFENTEFETDKDIIRPGSFNSLNELATLLLEHPTWKLRITGHTDNMGTAEWNMDLSRRRAESVKAYLANRGIDVSRMIVKWYGEEQPIADNLTAEGRQRNRRVAYEIVE